MAVQKTEKPGFIYIAYRRDNTLDFLELQKVLENTSLHLPTLSYIIIDLTKQTSLTSGEIGLIANFLKDIQSEHRQLLIITNEQLKKRLLDIKFNLIENVTIYDNRTDLMNEIQKKHTTVDAAPNPTEQQI